MQRLAVTLLPIVIVFQLTAGAVLPVQLPSSPVAGKLLQVPPTAFPTLLRVVPS